ncbi:MAG: hypothetical protein ACXWJ4_12660 [Methyloceanibacter sp.]
MRTELGCKATREGASAAAYLRSQGHFSFVGSLPNTDWIKPGS